MPPEGKKGKKGKSKRKKSTKQVQKEVSIDSGATCKVMGKLMNLDEFLWVVFKCKIVFHWSI